MKLNCDEINSICSNVVDSFLNDLDESAETKLTTGHTLRYDENESEWLWSRGGFCGPAAELLYLEATKLSCELDASMPADDYARAVAYAVKNIVVA